MKRLGLFTAIALIFTSLFFTGCSGEVQDFESDKITNVAMTTNINKLRKPTKITYTFNYDTPRIYCTFQVIDAPIGTSVTAEWVYVKGASNVENYLIDSWTEFTEGNKNIAMFINRLPNGWPSGDYEVVLYINGEPQGSIPFKVK